MQDRGGSTKSMAAILDQSPETNGTIFTTHDSSVHVMSCSVHSAPVVPATTNDNIIGLITTW
jgi:hypothetical protein